MPRVRSGSWLIIDRSGKMTAVIVSVLVAGLLVWLLQLKRNTKVWYDVPFTEGAAYVATQRILGDFENIEQGTVLTYQSTGFSRYDGYIGFFFRDSEGKRRRWDIRDDMNPVVEAKRVFAPFQKSPNQALQDNALDHT